MAVIDSKDQLLGINELLLNAAENVPQDGIPVEMVYASFVQEANMPNSFFLRYGNTIFILHGDLKRAGYAQFRALVADTAQNFLQAGFQFAKDAYEEGYYKLYTKFGDKAILNIFKVIARNPPQQGMGFQVVDEDENGNITVELTLGDPNGTQLKQPKPFTMPPPKDAMDAANRAAMRSGEMPPQMPNSGAGAPMQMPQGNPQSGGGMPQGGLSQLTRNPMQGEV